jgi:hypothetical protein
VSGAPSPEGGLLGARAKGLLFSVGEEEEGGAEPRGGGQFFLL